MCEKKIFCPCCGKTKAVRTVQYLVDKEEWEGFEDTENYTCTSEEESTSLRVSLPGAFIEAGPYNGSRCLAEYGADHYECTDCNKMFAVQG